jgi:ABC-type transport system involved in cytochrome c biogenesis permease subunit
MPTLGQLALLFTAIFCFAAGGVAALARLRAGEERPRLRIAAKACLYWGLLLSIAVVIWHSLHRRSWLPLEDNFDTFVWLGILLTLFVLYVQKTKPIAGMDFFLMPVVILLLCAAAIFGREKPVKYLPNAWIWVHLFCAFTGAAAFAVAAAAGAMYLITNARLRRKDVVSTGPNFGSLERLEHFTRISVTLGFALLTVGLVTGMIKKDLLGAHWFLAPKVILAFAVWIIYALVLHAPINPSFRGRKAAMLSVLGFLIMVWTLIAVQFMPASGGGR